MLLVPGQLPGAVGRGEVVLEDVEVAGARVDILLPVRQDEEAGAVDREIGLARGKKMFDKRESIKKKEDDRRMQRSMRERNR